MAAAGGEPPQKKQSVFRWVLIGFGVLLVLAFIGDLAGGDDEDATTTTAIPVAEVSVTEAPTSSEAPTTTNAPTTTEAPATTEAPTTTTTEAPTTTTTAAPEPQVSVSQENALRSAENYISMMAFSQSGLVKQLEFEGYSNSDARWAVRQLEVNWDEQAARSARQYLEMMPFSHSGMVEQLIFEGFTRGQAEYGATQAGL